MNRGKSIAFVGLSGGGKSTFLKVLRNLYHPRSLQLDVDGSVIESGFEGIARAISLIPQNPELFARTIEFNVTLGASYDVETVRKYMGMACFSEVVDALPKGLESAINEKGVNLSGGQAQRLALARGLLASSDKDIVLLDEPTSSLDKATERKVYENIFRELRDKMGKTIIASIHGVHLLPWFDEVCLLEDGEVVARGPYAELRATCPKFEALCAAAESAEKQTSGTVYLISDGKLLAKGTREDMLLAHPALMAMAELQPVN